MEETKLEEGDRVLIQALPPKRIVISKEETVVPNTRRIELEIEALEAKRTAIQSDLDYKHYQHKSGMPCEPGMDDDSVAGLVFHDLRHQRDEVAAAIVQKRLELLDLQGS
jgi:hypothetical protein